MSNEGTQTISPARIAIWLLSIGAAVLLILILGDSGPGHDFDGKVTEAVVLFAFFSLFSLGGFLLIERQPDLAFFGAMSIGLALAAYIVVLDAVLSGDLSSRHTSTVGLALTAIAAGQASMLLAFRREDDSPLVNAAVLGSLLTLALLVILTIVEISHPGHDIGQKTFAILAVLYLFGALLPPCLRWSEAEESY